MHTNEWHLASSVRSKISSGVERPRDLVPEMVIMARLRERSAAPLSESRIRCARIEHLRPRPHLVIETSI